MFSLKYLEIANWDYWQRFKVPLNANIITLVGMNGSGKTTFVDACRTLLGIDCSIERDYKRYARHADAPITWLRGVVTNPRDRNGRRAFFPITEEEVTLACRIQKAGGDWTRKYFIAVGDVPIEEFGEKPTSGIGIKEYRQRLAEAGLSPAMRKVLALEQGATDKLSEYSPRELLRLVWDTFGDQSVMDNYTNAKRDYEAAGRELEEAQRTVELLKATVIGLQAEREHYEEWAQRKQRLIDWQTSLLPLKQIEESVAKWRESREQRRTLLKNMRSVRENVEQLTREFDQGTARLHKYSEEKETADQALTAVENERAELERTCGAVKKTIDEKRRLERIAAAQASGLDVEAIVDELLTVRDELSRRRLAREATLTSTETTRHHVDELQRGQRARDPEVASMSEALRTHHIDHVLLADALNVTDDPWQSVIEGLLRPVRDAILLLNPDDRDVAAELVAAEQYRHGMNWELEIPNRTTKDVLLTKVVASQPVPRWLVRFLSSIRCVESVDEGFALESSQAGTFWATPHGVCRTERGLQYVGLPAGEFVLGESGRAVALAAAKERLLTLEQEIKDHDEFIQVRVERVSELEALRSGLDAAQELISRADVFALAEEQLESLTVSIEAVKATHRLAKDGVERIRERVKEQEIANAECDRLRSVAKGNLENAQQTLPVRKTVARNILEQLKQKLNGASARWRDPVYRQELIAASSYANVACEIFEQTVADEETWVNNHAEGKDASIILRHEKQAEELVHKMQLLDDRKAMRERTVRIVDEQRARYINVLKGTASAYQKNVRQLAEMAGIEAITHPVHVENSDVSLAHAGLDIIFRFDQKSLADVEAGDSSGGQKVMKSMILLVALMLDDRNPSGVVFIDEPFAHLDILNIDRVSRFLLKTNAQFLLTTPITNNRNVYAFSLITLMSQTLKPGARHALPIAFMKRRTPPA